MALLTAFFVFLLFTSGLYLMMRRHLMEVLLGVMLISQGTSLLILAQGGWSEEQRPPILVEQGAELISSTYADPLPQALILTAIVISFGITSFLIVLVLRGFEEMDDVEVGEIGRKEDEE